MPSQHSLGEDLRGLVYHWTETPQVQISATLRQRTHLCTWWAWIAVHWAAWAWEPDSLDPRGWCTRRRRCWLKGSPICLPDLLPGPSSSFFPGKAEGAQRESLCFKECFPSFHRSSQVRCPWPLTDLVIGFQAMICTAVHANLIKYLIQAPSGATVAGHPVLSCRHGPPRHLPHCTQLSIKQSDVGVPG